VSCGDILFQYTTRSAWTMFEFETRVHMGLLPIRGVKCYFGQGLLHVHYGEG